MKKAFRLAAIAIVAMGLTVACNNNKTEEVVDSAAMEIVEDTTDTIEQVAEEIVENTEESVKAVADETKAVVEDKTSNVTVDNANTSMASGKKKAPAGTATKSATTEVTNEASNVTVDNANTSMTSGKKKKK